MIEAPTDVEDVAVIVPLMPAMPDTTPVAPERLVPVKVTANVVPAVPLFGETEVSVEVVAAVVKELTKSLASGLPARSVIKLAPARILS